MLLAEGSKVSSQPCFTILPDRTFHVFGMGHMICNHLPSDMNKYIGTAVRHHVVSQELSASLVTKWLKSLLLLINTQHYSLFQIAICHQWRQRTLTFHPASYTVMTVDNSLWGIYTAWKLDCAWIHTMLRLRVTQFRDCANSQLARNTACWAIPFQVVHQVIDTCYGAAVERWSNLWVNT